MKPMHIQETTMHTYDVRNIIFHRDLHIVIL